MGTNKYHPTYSLGIYIMTCLPCAAGFHGECEQLTWEREPSKNSEDSHLTRVGIATCCCSLNVPVLNEILGLPRQPKEDEDIKDQTSTGRKRAAALYPIPGVEAGGMTCEWSGLAFAGGGVTPIIGCNENKIADTKTAVDSFLPGNVHHGPDKSTLNNEPTNVHRICPTCHNRWHAMNDPYYSKIRPESGAPYLPLSGECKQHDSETRATTEELAYSESYWSIPTRQREKIPYRPEGLR